MSHDRRSIFAVNTIDERQCFTEPRAFAATASRRLNVRRRAGDHAKDFARCCLLLQRLL